LEPPGQRGKRCVCFSSFSAKLGGPLTGTQTCEKLFSKPDSGGPDGLFPPGNPSIAVGGRSPPPQLMGFPEGRGRLDPQNRALSKISQRVGYLPGALLSCAVCVDLASCQFTFSYDTGRTPGAVPHPKNGLRPDPRMQRPLISAGNSEPNPFNEVLGPTSATERPKTAKI
jgi:hypothetical protein